jgi:hypothetical protein
MSAIVIISTDGVVTPFDYHPPKPLFQPDALRNFIHFIDTLTRKKYRVQIIFDVPENVIPQIYTLEQLRAIFMRGSTEHLAPMIKGRIPCHDTADAEGWKAYAETIKKTIKSAPRSQFCVIKHMRRLPVNEYDAQLEQHIVKVGSDESAYGMFGDRDIERALNIIEMGNPVYRAMEFGSEKASARRQMFAETFDALEMLNAHIESLEGVFANIELKDGAARERDQEMLQTIIPEIEEEKKKAFEGVDTIIKHLEKTLELEFARVKQIGQTLQK